MRALLYFIKWYLFRVPVGILKGGKNYIRFGFYNFSTLKLIKTLFSPWRRYKWKYGSFDFKKYMNVLASNLISRTLGAVMRLILIIVSLFYEVAVVAVTLFILILWFLLPFIGLGSFLLGIIILI